MSARRSRGAAAARAPRHRRGGRSGAALGEAAVGQRHAAEMLVGLVLLLGAAGGCWGLPGVRDHRQVARNVSRLLDDLLASDRYDKRIRPDFGGIRPTLVSRTGAYCVLSVLSALAVASNSSRFIVR